MECHSDQNAFITLKDHKDNFNQNTKCWLINPSKSEVGLVSKHYLNSIISTVAEKSGVNQWRNTAIVIDWFKNLPNKSKCRFIKFDIADFYPSITKDLLEKSIEYAKSFTIIECKPLKLFNLHVSHYYLAKTGHGWRKITRYLTWQWEALMELKYTKSLVFIS